MVIKQNARVICPHDIKGKMTVGMSEVVFLTLELCVGACWTLKFAKFLDVLWDDLGQHPPKPKNLSGNITSTPDVFFSERPTPNQII